MMQKIAAWLVGRGWRLAWVFLAVCLGLPAQAQSPGPAVPKRVVSLLPSLTETVCALGACDRLVGVDTHSNWPAQVQPLPKLGGLNDTSVEGIVALKPDLVLLAKSARVGGRLQSLGLRVVAIEPQSQAEARAAMVQVAQVLGLPAADGERRWAELEQRLPQPVWAASDSRAGARTVYFEVGGLYAASEASFIGEWLARLGARNIVPASQGPFPRLNPEFVVRANPWLIITSERAAADMPGRPGWAELGAVKARRICALTPAQTEVIGRPGPRMVEASELLAACLRRFSATSP